VRMEFLVPLGVFCMCLASRGQQPETRPHVTQAADFSTPIVRGGTFHMREHQGHVVLMAFLQTKPSMGRENPSRAVVPSLLSIDRQYRKSGVDVVIIDATALAGANPDKNTDHATGRASSKVPAADALLNASYDWRLTIPLLPDTNGAIARAYGVDCAPTILLVDRSGRIVERWTSVPHPGNMAAAIQQLVGGPMRDHPPMSEKDKK